MHPIRLILNNVKWGLMDYKFQGEEALRNSGQAYCIIRPGGLTGGDGQRQAKADPGTEHVMAASAEGDIGKTSSIHRIDVASVVVEAITSKDAENKTIEIVARPREDSAPAFKARIESMFAAIVEDEQTAR